MAKKRKNRRGLWGRMRDRRRARRQARREREERNMEAGLAMLAAIARDDGRLKD